MKIIQNADKRRAAAMQITTYNPVKFSCSKKHYELIATIVEPILDTLNGFIVGQKGQLTRTVLSLLAVGQCDINPLTKQPFLGCGHILFVGPTGTGKTILCKFLASLVGGIHKRVQGTPDLLASDITGFELLSIHSQESLKFREGPIFANILLVDEINRIPPKAASGLLQAMAEGIVTAANETYLVPDPFLCLGTMNPSEQAGTFAINEALSDRFMFAELMFETSVNQKKKIVRRTETIDKLNLKPITDLTTIGEARKFIFKNVNVSDRVLDYCARLIDAVNNPRSYHLFLQERAVLGSGTLFRQSPPVNDRTTIFLNGAAKAQAAIRYRNYVTFNDVRKIVPSVFRSRLSLLTESAVFALVDENGEALYRSKNDLTDGLISQILEKVPVV